MASTLGKVSQGRNDKKVSQGNSVKASCLKSDAEFKKIFGLTKDLRVCLTRIPDHLHSGKSFDSFSSVMKSSTNTETEFVVKEQERKQGFNKKRKSKNMKKMDHTKKRKTESTCNTVINGVTIVTSSQPLCSVVPTSDVSKNNIPTSCSKTREEKITEVEHCSHKKEEKGALSSYAAFEQSNFFSKKYTEDIFPVTPPELEETVRDEKIRRLKQVLREKEAALEEMRKKMQQK
ncbi:ligand-dependent nuclear receptor-interacting factor 1 isoform X4 [Urocitellus parryii]|nr:ligand-dependent nuclear receptor-interacting factor 1 isoform X4 [Urocitellus parryii]